jgi:hypothetical protein
MNDEPIDGLMARRGTGTAYDQLCNERRISDVLAAKLEAAQRRVRELTLDLAYANQKPTHAPDCAIAVNARHGCTCDAAPEYMGDGRWGLFHAQNCPRYDGDHAEVVTWMPELGVE